MDAAGVSKVCNGTFAESKVFTKVTGNCAYSNMACTYVCMDVKINHVSTQKSSQCYHTYLII